MWFAVLLLGVTGSAAAFAQVPSPPDERPNGQVDERLLEEIVVIGTRHGERSPGELQVPVDVLDGNALQAAGTGDILDTLTALIPSSNVGGEPISDAATGGHAGDRSGVVVVDRSAGIPPVCEAVDINGAVLCSPVAGQEASVGGWPVRRVGGARSIGGGEDEEGRKRRSR